MYHKFGWSGTLFKPSGGTVAHNIFLLVLDCMKCFVPIYIMTSYKWCNCLNFAQWIKSNLQSQSGLANMLMYSTKIIAFYYKTKIIALDVYIPNKRSSIMLINSHRNIGLTNCWSHTEIFGGKCNSYIICSCYKLFVFSSIKKKKPIPVINAK